MPLHPASAERLHTYLEAAGHAMEPDAALFQPVRKIGKAITVDGVYKCVLAYAARAKIRVKGFGIHSLRAKAATNALVHEADIARVQEWRATPISHHQRSAKYLALRTKRRNS
ncbi:hypothetical protein [Paraburkholderia humisilvae]|uniref:Uncharacterized protein n=1 Tax=Paraburkholderia humisilvae TaxID=627669 RepID=A0A6J5F937_9BURK|nr:hypothetical protein [Paraburkholderia humisilvae]CAB3774281.1 hypothetical protein LMG29542_07690 [Paraburkholderia humisilvae]